MNAQTENPNQGIIIMDLNPAMLGAMPVQHKILTVFHALADLIANPAFHSAEGLRIQAKGEGMLLPQEVILHLGKRGTLPGEIKGN